MNTGYHTYTISVQGCNPEACDAVKGLLAVSVVRAKELALRIRAIKISIRDDGGRSCEALPSYLRSDQEDIDTEHHI